MYLGKARLRNRMVTAMAVYRALEYCFDELNLHRVGAYIYSFNTNSWRIFDLAGARREMTLREHVLRDGRLHDVYAYGLLRRDFDVVRGERARLADGFSLESMIRGLAERLPEDGG